MFCRGRGELAEAGGRAACASCNSWPAEAPLTVSSLRRCWIARTSAAALGLPRAWLSASSKSLRRWSSRRCWLALLHREEAVGDGVGDRRCAVGVAVAPDHVEDVRVAIHRGLNLVLQCVGGLAGKPLRGPLEDITGPEERLQRREAPLHSLGITRLEDARGVRLHDLGRRAVGLREGERNDQDRQRQRDDDERNQPGAAPERVQMTREVDRLITVVGAPGASPERVDGLGHAIDDRTDPQSTRVLLVSSFVLPHVGGVEQFVETARGILLDRGYDVRILACRLPGADTTADDTVPTRFLGGSSWPLPVGGWRTVWQGVRQADVVVANNARHLLPVLAVLLARVQRKGAIFVVHGSGEGPQTGSAAFRVVRAVFQRTLARRAIRVSRPVSVSRVGVVSIRRLYGARPAICRIRCGQDRLSRGRGR